MMRTRIFFERYGIYVFLFLIVFFSSLVSPAFLKPQNIVNILNPAAALGMVAIGQTFVILTGRGGLDLSVASLMATVAVIAAAYAGGQDSQVLSTVIICLFFGILIGLINGLVITKLRVPPVLATLGMMIILQGGRFLYTKGTPVGSYPPIIRFLGTGFVGPIPTSVFSLAIMVVIATMVLKKTVFGRKVYAIGSNADAAILSGYNTDLILVMIYMISGLMASIAGLYLAGWLGIADNWIGQGYEIDSIAAVVMGGTSFEGGRGGVLGTMAGVLILIVVYNLVLLLGLPIQVQYMVKGAVIIIAASFYVRRRIR